MKYKAMILLLIIGFLIVSPPKIYAVDVTQGLKEEYSQMLEQSGANSLWDILPQESIDGLQKNNISQIDPSQLLDLNLSDFIKNIWGYIKTSLTLPISIFCMIIGIVLLAAILNSLKDGFGHSSFEKVFSVVCILGISGVIIAPISEIITSVAAVIEQVSNFLLAFIPVYVGIISASGNIFTAITYNTFLFSAIQVVSRVSATILVPLLGIYMGFCLIGSTTDQINIDSIAKGV
ncbi:MAG: hypothetical protein RR497_06285, partial [Oscillospiraceae bacterium]